MKHLKQYENVNQIAPQVGDYIQLELNLPYIDDDFTELINFLNTNIGKIIGFKKYDPIDNPLEVEIQYNKVPFNIKSFLMV